MPEMAATILAEHLRPFHTETGIDPGTDVLYNSGVRKRWPPASRIELRSRAEENRMAGTTPVGAIRMILYIFPPKGRFSASLTQDMIFLTVQHRLPFFFGALFHREHDTTRT